MYLATKHALCFVGFFFLLPTTLSGCRKSNKSAEELEQKQARQQEAQKRSPKNPTPPVFDFRGLGTTEIQSQNLCVVLDERCNGIDDDCDGVVDEDLSRTCGAENPFVCALGTQTCQEGIWNDCDGLELGSREQCNGQDDDCDGITDENIFPEGTLCNIPEIPHPCNRGVLTCENGMEVCSPIREARDETCNGQDDDCDGVQDEGDPLELCECENALFCPHPENSQCFSGRCVVQISQIQVPVLGEELEEFELNCEELNSDFRDCNDNFEDGCETPVFNNNEHCGECGIHCDENSFCRSGQCKPKAVAIQAGYHHSCLITANQKVYCWGFNYNRQLGQTSFGSPAFYRGREVPTIRAVIPSDGRMPSITTGSQHSCVLAWNQDQEAIACWGENIQGQLGHFQLDGSPGYIDPENMDLRGFPSDELGKVVKMDSGEDHSCALYTSGQVLCWGENPRYEVTGSSLDCEQALFQSCGLLPTRVQLPQEAMDVSCTTQSCCAVLTDQTVHCWGNLRPGIYEEEWGLSEGMIRVEAGWKRRCALRENQHQIECVVEHPDMIDFPHAPSVALRFSYPGLITDLSLNSRHACAIRKARDGAHGLFCWGLDMYGEMGNIPREQGTYIPQPVQVLGLDGNELEDRVMEVSTGNVHTCIIFESGLAQCFGSHTPHGVPSEHDQWMLGRGNPPNVPGYIPNDVVLRVDG